MSQLRSVASRGAAAEATDDGGIGVADDSGEGDARSVRPSAAAGGEGGPVEDPAAAVVEGAVEGALVGAHAAAAAAGGATAVGGDACGAMGTGVLGKLGPTPPLWLAAANEAAAARCACRPCSLSTRHTRRLASSETDARVVKSVGHHVTAVTSVGCPHSTTGGALGRAASQI